MDFSRRCASYGISYDLTVEQMVDWADAMGIEAVIIDNNTDIRTLKNEPRRNAIAYR